MTGNDLQLMALGAICLLAGIVVWLNRGSSKQAEIRHCLQTGMSFHHKQDYLQAQTYLERALKMLSEESDPDVGESVTCLVKLAECYDRTSNYADATVAFQAVIASWEKLLNSRDPKFVDIDYAAVNNDFGRGTQDICDFYINKVIPARSRMLPPGHQDIKNSYVIASKLLRKLGRNDEADKLQAQVG